MFNGIIIPEYHLFIHPLDLSELRKDIWCDDPIPAKLTINKRKYDIDIAYRGSHIRDFRKKSYHISFIKPSTYRNTKEIHINAEYKDPSLLRNKLSLDFFNEIGCLSPKSQFVNMKLNGKNEGLYLELESVDEYFLKNRQLPQGPLFYAVDGDANFSLMSDLDKEVKKSLKAGYELKYGTEQDEFHLQKMIIEINTLSKAEFENEIVKYINVNQYLSWLAGAVFTQNFDGFVHNYALYQNSETRQFEVIPWDYDATWGRDVNGKVMEEDYLRIEGFNTLTARILDVKTFRRQYKNLLKVILNNQFNVDYLKPKIQGMHNLIRPYIQKDPYKKNDIHLFDKEPEYILDYIEARAKYIRGKLDSLD
ncbi:spore coat protein [Lysinibacillus sp. FJAT-14745]|uniref:CotH kinase family protein n=1 Tax=Lysinibacillus sp. FJAT-14745 TaxID=1704289 RepID=UPI0006AB8BA0|nr:CotH kinase family protein [Lysinibacillus sp. FJAT-14745]KOP80895.1 spore coat protein [Lysinibacillus sp. FJAT-14745]